jgi:hypothetical protein
MANKYTPELTYEDNLLGVKIFKNGVECSFEDVVEDENNQFIILDLIAQAYKKGFTECNRMFEL